MKDLNWSLLYSVDSSLSALEDDVDWSGDRLEDKSHRVGILVLFWLLIGKVEELREVGCQELHVGLCEGLSKADSPASTEWAPAERIALLALRSQEQW